MGNVRTGLSVSLDGFIAGPIDSAEAPMGEGGARLLAWYSAGDTAYKPPGSDMVFMVSAQTAQYLARRAERPGRWCSVEGRSTSPTVGGETPPGRTGLCCYPLDSTRVGL